MDSNVAPERGLSSSMALYSHEGEGGGGGGRAFAPGVPRTERWGHSECVVMRTEGGRGEEQGGGAGRRGGGQEQAGEGEREKRCFLVRTFLVQPFLITRAEHGGIAWDECCLHVGNSSGDRIDYKDTRRCFESDATSSHPTFIHVRPHSEDCLRHLLKLQHSGRAPPGAQGLLQPEGGAADLQPLPARARGGHPGGAIVDFPPRAWRAEQGGSERHGSRRSECKWWRHMAVAVVQDCRDELRRRRAYEHLD